MSIAVADRSRAAKPPARSGRRAVLDENTLTNVWREYKTARTRFARDRLIEHYMHKHVRRIAERLHRELPVRVDVDDLLQQGYIGLADSLERFEPDRNVKFETFSGRRIFGSMKDYLRKLDHVPRLARRREKSLQRVTERFRKQHGRPPSDDELRNRLEEMPEPRFRRMMGADRPPAMVHFNTQRPDGDEGEDSDGMRGFEDHDAASPMRNTEHADLRRWVTSGFARRDQLIIILYFYERLTMREIGATLGISESRVSQRMDLIIECLRSRLNTMATGEDLLLRR